MDSANFSFSRADETYSEDRDFFSIFVRRRGRYGGDGGNSCFVILVIDAPGAVLSNNKNESCSSCRGSELVPSSFDMGDGKEGERQPLLKNENVTYSSHNDAIGGTVTPRVLHAVRLRECVRVRESPPRGYHYLVCHCRRNTVQCTHCLYDRSG